MATPDLPSPKAHHHAGLGDHRAHSRRRSPSQESDRKRHRTDIPSDDAPRARSYHDRPAWKRDDYDARRPPPHQAPAVRPAPYTAPYAAPYPAAAYPAPYAARGASHYENGFGAAGQRMQQGVFQRPVVPLQQAGVQTTKSRRLYIGNIPYQAGLTDVAVTQFFSALYVAGFRPNRPGEPLPVLSFWLHSDGKFGFMELRGEQETVNMMQFHGVFLHGRPLKVSRPSDYKGELHNPMGLNVVPEAVNIKGVIALCDQLGGVVAAPAQLAAIAATQGTQMAPTDPPAPAPAPTPVDPSSSRDAVPKPAAQSRAGSEPRDGSVADGDGSRIETSATTMPAHSSSPVTTSGPPKESTVISLRNLVTVEDLTGDDEAYQEILDDVQTECALYGEVLSLDIPRKGDWMGTAFIQFANHAGAKKAVAALSKRVFDGRQIESVVLDGCSTATEAASRPNLA